MENIKPPDFSELKEIAKKYSPFLAEARKRIFFTLAVFTVAAMAGFIFYEDIIRFLINILSLEGINIVFTSPFQFINLAISCGIATGLVVVLPLLIGQILSYLIPALKKREYKTVLRFLPFSIILFLIGFAFGAVIMKWQIEMFSARSFSLGIGNFLDISSLLATMLITSVLMGVSFQFPIALLILMRTGIIDRQQISRRRLWVYLGFFIFAILLPCDSILTDILLTLPLIVLFELALILDNISGKGRVKPPRLKSRGLFRILG